MPLLQHVANLCGANQSIQRQMPMAIPLHGQSKTFLQSTPQKRQNTTQRFRPRNTRRQNKEERIHLSRHDLFFAILPMVQHQTRNTIIRRTPRFGTKLKRQSAIQQKNRRTTTTNIHINATNSRRRITKSIQNIVLRQPKRR